MKATDDDTALEQHTSTLPVGRVRPATLDESFSRDRCLRADAVLALTAPLPKDLPPFETHVAGFVDGLRPVARIRKKTGLGAADLRIALASLYDRGLLALTGIVERAPEPMPFVDVGDERSRVVSGGAEVIPPHVMAEIQAMLDDEDE